MWLILCRVLTPQLLRSKPISILLLCEPVRLSCRLHRQPWGHIHRRGTCLCPPTKTIANRCQTCRLSAVPVQLSLAKQLLLFAIVNAVERILRILLIVRVGEVVVHLV